MLNSEDKKLLLELAKKSIAHGLETGRPLALNSSQMGSSALQQPGACFVTLTINDKLRGCIGCLQAYRPLVNDVIENAYSAAFRDHRFPPVTEYEFPQLHYHISLLGVPEPMSVGSEEDLLNQLVPKKDGLIIDDGRHRATFLPSVWQSLPEPKQFLLHLKRKAGMADDYWSSAIEVKRYRVESVE